MCEFAYLLALLLHTVSIELTLSKSDIKYLDIMNFQSSIEKCLIQNAVN